MSKLIQLRVNSIGNLASIIEELNREISGHNVRSISFDKTGTFKGLINVLIDEPEVIKVPMRIEVIKEVEVVKEVIVPVEKEIIKEIYMGEHVKVIDRVKKQKGVTSQYWGVYKRGNSWIAMTSDKGQRVWIGTYKYEMEAAEAYDEVAFDLRGKDAQLNFPESYGLRKDKY